MSQFGKAFEPTGATVNEAVTGSAETVSLAGRLSDRDGVGPDEQADGAALVFIDLDNPQQVGDRQFVTVSSAPIASGVPMAGVPCASSPRYNLVSSNDISSPVFAFPLSYR